MKNNEIYKITSDIYHTKLSINKNFCYHEGYPEFYDDMMFLITIETFRDRIQFTVDKNKSYYMEVMHMIFEFCDFLDMEFGDR